jgi:flagellar protein FlbD
MASSDVHRMEQQMILVTRLNGPPMAINADLIERAETTPDTVVTLIDGTKYLVEESVAELVEKVREHRAIILALAGHLERANIPAVAEPRVLRVLTAEPGEG